MLIGHGSRDRRSAIALTDLAATLTTAAAPVATALLECQTEPLSRQLADLAIAAQQAGCSGLSLHPLFLLAGTHVCEDIPAELVLARSLTTFPLHLQSFLGEAPLESLIEPLLLPDTPRILVAHGSRRPGALAAVEHRADRLRAKLAFWSQPPRLTDVLQHQPGPVVVIPYFLFPGGICDTLAEAIADQPEATLLPPLVQLPGFEPFLRQWLGLEPGV